MRKNKNLSQSSKNAFIYPFIQADTKISFLKKV